MINMMLKYISKRIFNESNWYRKKKCSFFFFKCLRLKLLTENHPRPLKMYIKVYYIVKSNDYMNIETLTKIFA